MLYSCINNTKLNKIRLTVVSIELPPLSKIALLNGYECAVDGE